MDKQSLATKFKVHERLIPYMDYFLTDEDRYVIDLADDLGIVPEGHIDDSLLEREYQRGVLNKQNLAGAKRYVLASFHTRIDCCLRGERAVFESLPSEVRSAVVDYEQDIDLWVIPYRKKGVNQKIVNAVPLEHALHILDSFDGRFWVQECDCKAYRGHTRSLTETCLHLMTEDKLLNSNFDRGYARELSREEAKNLLEAADKDGLVHNFGGDSFCNCCRCCCWALRGIEHYKKSGFDVLTEYVNAPYLVQVDAEACKGCGLCAEVCPGHALALSNGVMTVEANACLGCGVCRQRCASGALSIVKRQVVHGNAC